MIKTAGTSYPPHLDFIERLAKKVLTRIVSDGISLDNAIKEATHVGNLNTQQIFHLCSVLEDFGQIFNGDQKNYYFTSNDMGKEFPGTQNGYVVYANATGKNSRMKEIFKTVEALKKQGFTDQEILAINGELEEVLNVMSEFNTDYKTLVADFESSKTQAVAPVQQAPAPISNRDKSFIEKGKDWIGDKLNNLVPQPAMMAQPASSNSNYITAQLDNNLEVEESTPENVNKIKAEDALPKDDLNVSEDELGDDGLDVSEDEVGAGLSASITPTPDELMDKIKNAPKWEVQNILSMQKAENFFNDLQKELDAVAYNQNILMDMSSVAKYDKVRAAIESATNKIKEAQKGVEKIEKKENDLQEKYQNPNEAPTDQLISEEPIVEESLQTPPAANPV